MPLIQPERNPAPKKLRQFCVALAVVATIAGSLAFWKGFPVVGWIILFALVVPSVAGIASAMVARRVYYSALIVTTPISTVFGYALLGLVYFGILTPTALLLRVAKRKSPFSRDRGGWQLRAVEKDPLRYYDPF